MKWLNWRAPSSCREAKRTSLYLYVCCNIGRFTQPQWQWRQTIWLRYSILCFCFSCLAFYRLAHSEFSVSEKLTILPHNSSNRRPRIVCTFSHFLPLPRDRSLLSLSIRFIFVRKLVFCLPASDYLENWFPQHAIHSLCSLCEQKRKISLYQM